MGKPKNQSAGKVKKRNRMRDRVAMPRAKCAVEKCRSVLGLQENALEQEQLPETHVTKSLEIGPGQAVKKLCGIILQAALLVWGRKDG